MKIESQIASLKRIPFDIFLLIGGGVTLLAVQMIFGGGFNFGHRSFLVSAFTAVLALSVSMIVMIRSRSNARTIQKSLKVFMDWAAVVGLVFIYGNLRDVSALYAGPNITPYLANFDALLGVSPTVFASRFIHPVITDFFTIVYGLYLITPLALASYVYFRGSKNDFTYIKLSLVIVMFSGFILYILFPAAPPRFHLEYPNEITGILFSTLQPRWDAGSFSSHLGAFPSLHVGIAAVSTFSSFAIRKRLAGGKPIFYASTAILMLISLSTVYLRHHWILDIIAGLTLAYFAHLISKRWRKS